MRRHRHAKIVATLGPASSSPEMIRALFEAGADVFRFNFSHGSHEDHQKRYDIVRSIEQDTGRPIAVLADLQGPKLRVGRLAEGPIALEEGERVRFDLEPAPGTRERIPLPHPEVFAALAPTYRDLPRRFVLMTGFAFSQELRAFLARHPVDLLHKPFRAADLEQYAERVAGLPLAQG